MFFFFWYEIRSNGIFGQVNTHLPLRLAKGEAEAMKFCFEDLRLLISRAPFLLIHP